MQERGENIQKLAPVGLIDDWIVILGVYEQAILWIPDHFVIFTCPNRRVSTHPPYAHLLYGFCNWTRRCSIEIPITARPRTQGVLTSMVDGAAVSKPALDPAE